MGKRNQFNKMSYRRPCGEAWGEADRFPIHGANSREFRAPLFPIGTPTVQAVFATLRPRNVAQMETYAGAFLVDAGPDEWRLHSRPSTGQGTNVARNTANVNESAGREEPGHVRLLAYYTPAVDARQSTVRSKGLVILLHGWEGSSHSMLNLVLGTALIQAGYDIVRLNIRDHGPVTWFDPVALNEGMFLAILLDEVRRAVRSIAETAGDRPVFVFGPSLGGNFVLRLAAEAPGEEPLPVRHMIAVSPVVNPARTIDLIDRTFSFRGYFRKRWLRTLQRKAAAFPDRYDFAGLDSHNLIRPMTEWLIRRYTDLESADAYFARYSFLGDAARSIAVPTTILAAADDPVIPVHDIEALADSPLLARRIVDWGGHVGFITWPPLRHLLPQMALEILSAAV